MDHTFVETARLAFNPHNRWSGTESVAPLLHALVRIGRYETVAEFGSGYSTLFLAKALADNHADYVAYRRTLAERIDRHRDTLLDLLREESATNGSNGDAPDLARRETLKAAFIDRMICTDSPPMAPNPYFFRAAYEPRLFVWEPYPETSEYVTSLRRTLATLALDRFVTLTADARIPAYLAGIPETRRPVGLAWNDFGNKTEFFDETYDQVAADGGILAFHSPLDFQREIELIKLRLRDEVVNGACEYMTLVEPHKVIQNSCFLVRRCARPVEHPMTDLRRALSVFLEITDREGRSAVC